MIAYKNDQNEIKETESTGIVMRKGHQIHFRHTYQKTQRYTLEILWTYIDHKFTRYTPNIPEAKFVRYSSDTQFS